MLVSGSSGTGKTILSLEWLFNGVKLGENGVYITITEPLFKTLYNLEGLSFYNREAIENEQIKILDIRKPGLKAFDAEKILELIESEVKKNNAKRLVIDSITAIAYNVDDKAKIRKIIFDLGTMLASLGCTTFLTSEVSDHSRYSVYGVEEFISDGVIVMRHEEQKFQNVRTLEIVKMRGISYQGGSNSFRITKNGIKMYPQLIVPLVYGSSKSKISIGVKGFDEMAKGGVYEGSSNLIAGSTGAGKSILGMHFIWEGLQKGEPCLLAGFEESRDQILRNAASFGWDLEKYEKLGLLKISCAYPSEKYIEEHLLNIKDVVDSMKIKRCVIDSLSSIGNSFEVEQFRYFVKRLNAYLKSKNVTSIFTTATAGLMTMESLTESHLSTMTDNIFLLKYVEAEGEMRLMAAILKTRGNDHSKSLREYKITGKGIVIGQTFKGFENVMAGSTRKVGSSLEEELQKTFVEYLGPIGITEFNELKEQGHLREEDVLKVINEMIAEGSLKGERGDALRARIHTMYGTFVSLGADGEAEEAEGAEGEVYSKKKGNAKENNNPPKKRSFFSRLFGKKEVNEK